LETLEDLDDLSTLGFRGEALASIAAVSKMELVTKTRDSSSGVRISVQGGELVSVDEVGATDGTAVEVRDLFYNVPARRRFMKGPAAEGARVTEAMQRLAVTRPDVHFIHVVAGREVLNAPPTTSLQDRAVEVLGRDVARYLVPIPFPGADARISVTGAVGKPQMARPNKGQLLVSVNGRPVDAPQVSEAARAAFGELLFRGRWPVAIIDVAIDPAMVDVNVHPSKREVLFREPDMVRGTVERSVGQALLDADITTEVTLPVASRTLEVGIGGAAAEPPLPTTHEEAPAGPTSIQLDLGGGALEEDRLRAAIETMPIVGEQAEWTDLGHLPSWLVSLRPLGQVLDTYIVCEGEDAMYLIDHTRDALEALGFSFFVAEDGGLRVVALPAMLGERPTQEDVDVLIQDILSGEVSGTTASKEAAIRSMACHLSIRAGQRLTPKQVIGLLRGMAGSRDPLACVHGRPTVIRVRRGELERMFRRTE
jgi:DNA mismatch repair protein MutL